MQKGLAKLHALAAVTRARPSSRLHPDSPAPSSSSLQQRVQNDSTVSSLFGRTAQKKRSLLMRRPSRLPPRPVCTSHIDTCLTRSEGPATEAHYENLPPLCCFLVSRHARRTCEATTSDREPDPDTFLFPQPLQTLFAPTRLNEGLCSPIIRSTSLRWRKPPTPPTPSAAPRPAIPLTNATRHATRELRMQVMMSTTACDTRMEAPNPLEREFKITAYHLDTLIEEETQKTHARNGY